MSYATIMVHLDLRAGRTVLLVPDFRVLFKAFLALADVRAAA